MRFVPVKTQAQQALAMLNSLRDSFIKDRTATVNRIQAALLEVGISLASGFKSIKDLAALLETSSFSGPIRKILMGLHEHFSYLDGKVKALDKDVECRVGRWQTVQMRPRLRGIDRAGTKTALSPEHHSPGFAMLDNR